MITKANINHLNEIITVLKDTIVSMNAQGLYQWNENYPNEKTIISDIDNEELFVKVEENSVKGFVVLNQLEDKDYEKLSWTSTRDTSLVIHRLCVSPKFQGSGVAKEIMEFTHSYAKENGYEYIRLDTSVKNTRSISVYEKHGYNNVGVISTEKGDYVCFEKFLM
ncbi:MAG: GNAT family N-acetyltransferase [Clostridium sp.]